MPNLTTTADLADPTATGGFVHLHTHTEYSKQDGLSRVGDLAARAAGDAQPAVAMTDHGNIAGAWKFTQACAEAGVKPILGVEAYLALVPDGSGDSEALDWDDPQVRYARFTQVGMDAESGKAKRQTNNHLTILARNETGWRNLVALMNAAEESFFHKPLIDYALLKKHGRSYWDEDTQTLVEHPDADGGLIVLSGCLGGPVASHVAAARSTTGDGVTVWDEDRLELARTNLDRLVQCVGARNVYVEVMEHGLASEGFEHIKALFGLAREADLTYTDADGTTRLQVVATNDSHYVDCDDHDAHDSWLVNGERARGNNVRKDDPDRWRFNGEGYWLRSEAEMRALYPQKGWQDACDETVRLAARIADSVIPFQALRLPRFPVPADVVSDWEAGTEAVVTDINGAEHPARRVGSRAFGSPSALHLRRLVKDGVDARYGGIGSPLATELGLRERIDFEFDVITTLGLEDYFLIVWDVLAWARSDRGLPTAEYPDGAPGGKRPILVGPGRGSAAGSAISYCLQIVMVEPLANGLLFERFLDVDRVGMPDIDVDFEAARRDEVYDYLAARYGAEYVARIGAFQVAKTKRALKDAARVLDQVPLGEQIAKLVPVHQGTPQTFATLFEEDLDEHGMPVPNPQGEEFRTLVAANPTAAEVVALARKFEGVAAGESIHAAGIIIADEPLPTLIPMRRTRDKKTGQTTGVPIALWDGKDVDSFGMLKLDALSLINLDIISVAVANIAATTGETVDPEALPDPNTTGDPRVAAAYALLRDGKTAGVFQLESSGITELCENIAPTAFNDLSALVALYRPGPMGAGMHNLYADRKNGRAEVNYDYLTDDPTEQAVIASVLDDTFGVICYQESLMTLAELVAGFSAEEKNRLRRAFSKKKRSEMEALKDIFLTQGAQTMPGRDGTIKPAFAPQTLQNLWVTFDASAEYLFNRAHSAAYGHIAYVTAYLKANWPTAYGAGILAVVDKAEKRGAALESLARDGIEVLAPDVNRSLVETAPDPETDKAVRLGLGEIRDVGSNGRWVVAARESGGPFASVVDLMTRVRVPDQDGRLTAKLPVTAVEGLVEAGAFDSFGHGRLGIMLALRALSAGHDVPIPDAEWSNLERAARQRIRLGVSLGEHPLSVYKEQIKTHEMAEVETKWGETIGARLPRPMHAIAGARGDVATAGLLTAWTERTTRAGKKMVNFTLEGSRATMTGVAFSDACALMRASGTEPQVGDLVAVFGRVKTRTVVSNTIAEDGAEVEETREVSELMAANVEVVDVDTATDLNLAETDPTLLRDVLAVAWQRAAQASAGPTTPLTSDEFPEPAPTDQGALFAVPDTPAPQAPATAGDWGAIYRAPNACYLLPDKLHHVAGSTDRAVAADIRKAKLLETVQSRYTAYTNVSPDGHVAGGLRVLVVQADEPDRDQVEQWVRISHQGPDWRPCRDAVGWFYAPLSHVVEEAPVGTLDTLDGAA